MTNDFGRAAAYYDDIFAARAKDYALEAQVIERVIRERNVQAATLLDVACGTAGHLAFLSRRFQASGLDRDREMLAIAKTRVPDISLVHADMRTFSLNRTFDAVVCLFGAIAYLESVQQLERSCRVFREHLVPGGLLIIEPFVTPSAYIVGDVSMVTIDRPDLKLSRMHVSEREGDVAVLDHHFQVADARGIHSFVEEHRLYLFSEEDFLGAFAAASLSAEYLSIAPFQQGLYVARAV